MSMDPYEREEKLVEIVPAGADLGMYEDVAVGEPNDDLVVRSEYIDLPALDLPPYEEASKIYELALEELKAALAGTLLIIGLGSHVISFVPDSLLCIT